MKGFKIIEGPKYQDVQQQGQGEGDHISQSDKKMLTLQENR